MNTHDVVYIHAVEDDPALERKEILTYAIAWTNPKDIMLSELSQSLKDKY